MTDEHWSTGAYIQVYHLWEQGFTIYLPKGSQRYAHLVEQYYSQSCNSLSNNLCVAEWWKKFSDILLD